MWLEIQRAKSRGLLMIRFEHDQVLTEIMEWMKSNYIEPDPGNRYEKDWRTFFDEIIERVVCKILRPDLEKRAEQELKERSIEFVIAKMKENFCKNYLMIPPYLFQKKQ